jgi:hypothetical protein
MLLDPRDALGYETISHPIRLVVKLVVASL